MRLVFISWFLICSIFSTAQCIDPIVVDPSFEIEPYLGEADAEIGQWYRSDGCQINNSGYESASSACSNGGGAFQYIAVEPNTTYYLSCYIFGGASDYMPSFLVNWQYPSIVASGDDWEQISISFNSGNDTVSVIGFYAYSACFDQFTVTCDPVLGLEGPTAPPLPFALTSTTVSDRFELSFSHRCQVEVFDLKGQLVEEFNSTIGNHTFGSELTSSMYILKVTSKGSLWTQRIVKR